MDWIAIKLSVQLAVTSTLVLLPFGIFLAWLMVYGSYKFKILLEIATSLFLVLPPTVIGFYFLQCMGPRSIVGLYYQRLTGASLLFNFGGLLLTQVVINLPFFLKPLVAALEGVDYRLIEVASTLGSSKIGIYFKVVLPIAWRGVLSGIIFSFTHIMGEFGVVLMVGGGIPNKTRTASIVLFDQVQILNFNGANKMALLLFMIAACGTISISLLRFK